MGIKLDGFDELSNKLNSMANNAQELAGENEVSFDQLFIESFIKKHTKYSNMNEFLKAVGVTDNESFDKLPNEVMDKHVSDNTDFSNWEEMQTEALSDYVGRQIGF